MHTSIFTINNALLVAVVLAASALMYTQASAQSYDYNYDDYVRTYQSDDNGSHIRIETRAASDANSEIRNTVRTYSNSSNNSNSNNEEQHESWSTSLRGSQEVPPVVTETTGDATFTTNGDNEIDFELNVYDGEDITAAHLHCAPSGENGPVVVSLFSASNGIDIDGTLREGIINDNDITSNCAGIDTVDDLVSEIHRGDIYANVHSTSKPDGLIRGQLTDNNDNDDNDDTDNGGHNVISNDLLDRIDALIQQIKDLTEMLDF